MSWWRKLFPDKPERLPEGFLKVINIKDIIVYICGENHPQLKQRNKAGGTMQYNNVIWLRGYRRADGLITVKPDDAIIAHEFRRLLAHNSPGMANANQAEEL